MPERRRREPASPPVGGADARRAGPRRGAAILRVSLVSLALIAGLFVFVFPTRTYLSQRADVQRAQERLDLLRAENARLEQETTLLSDPAEVERIARERFGLVRPGERAFAVVPAPPPPVVATTTTAPPATGR